MRKKQPMFSKSDLKFIGWMIGIMLLFCLPFLKVYGASYNHLKYFSNSSRLDSVIIIITEDGTPTSTTVIGTDTTLVLNDIYDYYLQYLWFWDGLDEYVTDGEYIKFTAGVATVDTSAIKTLASNNPSLFYGPTASGSGSDSVVIYAIDTSGTDSTVNQVKITVVDSTGAASGIVYTSGNGNALFTLDPGSYTVRGLARGYVWNNLALTVSGNSDSETVTGYNIQVSTPSDTGYCNVYGYVYSQGQPVPYASVTLTLPSHAYDSCNNTILIDKVFTDKNGTDENGYFSITVPKSSCLNRDKDGDLMEYKAVARKKGSMTKEYKFSIPADSSTYYLVF